MKLAEWRKRNGMTQAALAEALACSQSYVSQIERRVGAIVPGAEVMGKIYEVTAGAVQPNDFYDLPAIVPVARVA